MANTITIMTFKDQTKSIEVMKIINCLKNGWSWLDIVVEFETTIENVKEGIETCEYVSVENKRMVKNYNRLLNKTPKSKKLRDIIKKGEMENLPPYVQRVFGHVFYELPYFSAESTTATHKEKQEASESESSTEEVMGFTRESPSSIFEELHNRKAEVKECQRQIEEIVSNNIVEQELLTDIDERHKKLCGNVADLLDQLKKIRGELVELANRKIEAQTRIQRNEKLISILEAQGKEKEEEIERLCLVKVFLNEDGTYPDIFKEMLPTEEDIDRLQLEYMKRGEFKTFAAMHIEYMAKIMALVKVLDVFEFNCEVEFNEEIPVPVRGAIHQLLSEK